MTKNRYVQIEEMLVTVEEAVDYLEHLAEETYDAVISNWMEDLRSIVESVNNSLLDSARVSFCDLDHWGNYCVEYKSKNELTAQFKQWKVKMTEVLQRQYFSANSWEERFARLMDYICYVDREIVIENARQSLKSMDSKTVWKLCKYYQQHAGFWGTLDVADNRYDVIINRVTALREHGKEFQQLFDKLGDWRSRIVLTSMLYNWITFDPNYILGMKEANFTDYFDLDLVMCDEQEVVVDVGAWIGDSALNYIQTYGKYKRIYCYEIDASSMEKMKENLKGYADIVYRNKGAGSQNCKKYIANVGDSSCNQIVDYSTEKEVEIVRLDDDIDEKVTLIKMDIEGAEQDALAGCSRHIREEAPKLLICVYHNNEDIYKIPQMILEMNPNYRFYLRSNGSQWGPAEIVLLAIPN